MSVGDNTDPIRLYWPIGQAKRLEVLRGIRVFLSCRKRKPRRHHNLYSDANVIVASTLFKANETLQISRRDFVFIYQRSVIGLHFILRQQSTLSQSWCVSGNNSPPTRPGDPVSSIHPVLQFAFSTLHLPVSPFSQLTVLQSG